MSVQNYFILTAAQRATAVGYNNSDVAVDPRPADNGSPGVGLNLNDAAVGIAPGDPVALTGAYVIPKRVVDDAEYATYAPGLIVFLLTLPWAALEAETIFAPAAGPRG